MDKKILQASSPRQDEATPTSLACSRGRSRKICRRTRESFELRPAFVAAISEKGGQGSTSHRREEANGASWTSGDGQKIITCLAEAGGNLAGVVAEVGGEGGGDDWVVDGGEGSGDGGIGLGRGEAGESGLEDEEGGADENADEDKEEARLLV
ncbi:uncharacterized protein LOC133716701 [Rosa rugosa]|uniref:uncharacterized protein LOC133716701 n=1 Tax=Rosa rugosa TaxID=74645 RepID=UPI002B4151C4|nr:uncharacterized protein LOC133716701 [Rosa rugosa]